MILTFAVLILAGVAAGALTTVASLGGGILVIAFMSLFWPPATVLGVTAPALFVGNVSRVAMLVREVDWATTGRFAVTAVPAAFCASLVAAWLPADALKLVVAGFLFVFVGHELGVGRKKVDQTGRGAGPTLQGQVGGPGQPENPAQGAEVANSIARSAWLPALGGVIAGAVSGLAGGAGFVASPFLHKLGLSPRALVATSAACMALVHLTKGAGFTLAKVLTPALVPLSVALAVGLVAGNALGTRVLARMSRQTFRKVLVGAVGLAGVHLLCSAIF